jgi:hypothetical protein
MSASNCFIPRDKLDKFVDHIHGKGFVTRPYTSVTSVLPLGIQIKVGTQWFGVVYNKNFKRYTVDIRLKDFVQSFKSVL